MFRCEICNQNIVGERINFKTIKKRPRKYHYYTVLVSGNEGHKSQIITEDSELAHKDGNKIVAESDTEGWEIAEEIKTCKICFEK